MSQFEKTEDIFGKPSSDLEYQCKPTELVMVDILNPPDILLKSISVNEQNNGPEKEVYFYHGDHLGSASWITDSLGVPVQYIHYAPYGELIDNQTAPSVGYDERYKFTGKERDRETGYDAFGARYYWSAIGHFMSPDPLSDKTPGISAYAYCLWTPVKYVDPDGRYSMENIDGGTDYKTILVLPSDQVLNEMKYKDRGAFLDTYQQARSEKMPIMRIDNAEDYVNAMAALMEMNSSTDSYVLSTSHGYRKNICLDIGSDKFTTKKGDFSQFRNGLSGKTVFITACRLAANQSGVNLIENFANATGSTIIGAEFPVPALLGGFRGGSLSNSPIRNAIYNLFDGYCENSFKITNGVNTNTVYGVTIDKNRGIRWNCR